MDGGESCEDKDFKQGRTSGDRMIGGVNAPAITYLVDWMCSDSVCYDMAERERGDGFRYTDETEVEGPSYNLNNRQHGDN